MIITAGVRIGTNKPVCDDIAIINDVVVNDDHHQCEADKLQVVGITDGVGGNAGGKEASLFVAEALSKMTFAEDEGGIRIQLEQLNRDLLEYAATIPDPDVCCPRVIPEATYHRPDYLPMATLTRTGRGSRALQ